MRKSLAAMYFEGQGEKKRKFNDRIINVEKGTFTPLVFSTTGGMAPECTRLNKRRVDCSSDRRKLQPCHQPYPHTTAICTAESNAGGDSRSARENDEELEMNEISFNLIPRATET